MWPYARPKGENLSNAFRHGLSSRPSRPAKVKSSGQLDPLVLSRVALCFLARLLAEASEPPKLRLPQLSSFQATTKNIDEKALLSTRPGVRQAVWPKGGGSSPAFRCPSQAFKKVMLGSTAAYPACALVEAGFKLNACRYVGQIGKAGADRERAGQPQNACEDPQC